MITFTFLLKKMQR